MSTSTSATSEKSSAISLLEYVELLKKSNLIPVKKLVSLCNQFVINGSGQSLTIPILSQMLMEKDYLTDWQNEKLLKGRYNGFFLGEFRLLDRIGSGGMTAIFLAQDKRTRNSVVLKVLLPSYAKENASLQRFCKESQCKDLKHPNIVRVMSSGFSEMSGMGTLHYMVSEHVEGTDLHQLVQKEGPLSFELTANIIRQIADGLAHAHHQGIIHRNLKPSNLVLDSQGQVKITNLGVARFMDEDDSESLTLLYEENAIGTVACMAPEQLMNSHNVDGQADLYSLGCTMYYFLTGKFPFEGGTKLSQMMRHLKEAPPDIKLTRPDAPAELLQFCYRLMAKNKSDRFDSARSVSEAFRRWLSLLAHRPKLPSESDFFSNIHLCQLGPHEMSPQDSGAICRETRVTKTGSTVVNRGMRPDVSTLNKQLAWDPQDVQLEFSNGRWVPSHPDARKVNLNDPQLQAVFSRGFDYCDQQELLETIYDWEQENLLVANFGILHKVDGEALSYSVWIEDVLTLLPKTDLIVFVPNSRQEPVVLSWEDAEDLVGKALISPVEGLDPDRYRVKQFPSEQALVAIAAN